MGRECVCVFASSALGPTAHHTLDLFMRLDLATHRLAFAYDEAFVCLAVVQLLADLFPFGGGEEYRKYFGTDSGTIFLISSFT